MSLLISENETFEVKVKFVPIPGGITCFEEKEEAPPEAVSEWFKFKRPNWEETCEMMSYAMVPYNGSIVLNPYRLVDAKLKVLMTAWSLKDGKGNPLECKPSNIAKLNPAICEYLSKQLDFAAMPNISGDNEQEPVEEKKALKTKGRKSKAAKTTEPKVDAAETEPKKQFFEEDKKDDVSIPPGLQETQEIPKPPPEASPQ